MRLAQNLTLAAAHSLGVRYTRGERRFQYLYIPPTVDVDPGDDFETLSIGTGTSSLTLSIYF